MYLDVESNKVKRGDFIENLTYRGWDFIDQRNEIVCEEYDIYEVLTLELGVMICYSPVHKMKFEYNTNNDFKILPNEIAKKLLIKHMLTK